MSSCNAHTDFFFGAKTSPEDYGTNCAPVEPEQRTYGERETVPDMLPCMKRPIVVHAKQINEPFRVNSMEGDYKQGKPGDYLMRGIDGELYICDRDIFERSYGWVE